jgi:hypothetical protein
MVYISMYTIANGNPARILAPVDADGKVCGKDSGYENYPMLYWQTINDIQN